MVRKYAYWISTSLVSLIYLASAVLYSTQGDQVRAALGALGYPGYLVPVLIVVKLLGVAAVVSRVNIAISDLAYAGMFYHLLLAISAHLAAADYAGALPAFIGLAALIVSFLTQNAARSRPSPYVPSALG